MSDVIAAAASGAQLAAIGIIRLSGDGVIDIIDKVFLAESGKKMALAESRKLCYGRLFDTDGAILDYCMCTVSRAPNSYTGEDSAELHCHGSPTVISTALSALFASGARQALPGEFTKRAFLNGRMDLTQSEAVADLISAETAESAKNAAGQLGGAVLRVVDSIYDSLTEICAHYHAVLDYPDEDIEPFELHDYHDLLKNAESAIERLLLSFERGRVLVSGVKTAIIGKPNTGKSSLLNALLGYDRAIVSDMPGTTRDTINERVRIGSVLLQLIDTAGLRGAVDSIERIGVERARAAAREAELIIAVFDGSDPLSSEDRETIETARLASRSIAVINKDDLPQKLDINDIHCDFQHVCFISAKNKTGLQTLDTAVNELFPQPDITIQGEILSNARQAEAARRALVSIKAALSAMATGITPDAVLSEVEGAMRALAELTGRAISEDVTSKIFERFCVGK